ncbi:C4-dicarboxylate TRAP transporter substrate-binding protein [Pseudodesulfovibrio thermohalotolerans]|uniref:C4-dicarboxylate TRAP transporter substrate-binding protein n=1 Tax=Pseudodesulfovibrio thermohalotolerans TaxID=2880651 RepID=UPI0022BA040B|nr:C4-dicarboxylate TRAP transporter substrate-binding protein [Pseudodesulfovibrio thermohalotolerans]WFS62605.1 C4-dicarboxylate TRAP transporter substrate-binding protein [Pseudodesulfovibrio thermohalotolerans]
MKSVKTTLVALLAGAVLILAMSGIAQAKTTIRLAYENNPGEPLDQVAHKWADLVKERSNGEVELLLFPSSQLGGKKDILEMAKMGVNVITICDAGFLADYVPDFGILVGPYLAESPEKIFKLFKTGWYNDLAKQLESKGLHIVTSNWLYGVRHMVTTKPVKSPADMKGLKIRVPNNRIQIAALKSMGATPTPMPLGEVYPALTQGIIDGAENPLSVLYGQKLYEPAKYIELIGYLTMTAQWVGGQAYFDTLPADVVTLLQETGDEAGLYSRKVMAEEDEKIIKKMIADGSTLVDVDTAAFREMSKSTYSQFPEWTPGLYEKVQKLLAE